MFHFGIKRYHFAMSDVSESEITFELSDIILKLETISLWKYHLDGGRGLCDQLPGVK